MGIPMMNLLPFTAPPKAGSNAVAQAHDDASAKPNGFEGLLASLSGRDSPALKAAPSEHSQATPPSKPAKQQLEHVLSSLSGGQADLDAPGLGLTAQQQHQLAANLEKLLKDGEDGAQLLASLLAASHLSAGVQPADLAALAQLLSVSAKGTVSVDALASNLHLLSQAVRLIANSDGKVTLLQAIQELTPRGDAFAQQLAEALAESDATSEDPIPIDTGPPEGGTAVGAAGEAASRSAGSDGRELTVTPNGATSPADGATEEAASQANQGAEDVSALAKLIESLLKTQQAEQSAHTAASEPTKAQAAPTDGVAQAIQADPATLLAQMAPGQAKAAQPAQAAAKGSEPSQPEEGSTEAKPGVEAVLTPAAPAPVQPGTQDQTASQNGSSQPQTNVAGSDSQAGAAPVAPNVAPTFASALEMSRVAAEAPARPVLEQAIVDQVIQNAVVALRDGQQEFRIQLKPDFLGAMEVRVSMDNGLVTVRMSVESAATRQLIDNNIGQLRQAFGGEQVRVEHVPSFTASDAPWTFNQGAHQGFWQGYNGQAGAGRLPEAIPFVDEPELAPAGVAQNAPPSGGIDLQA